MVASRMRLPRSLPTRSMSVATPSIGPMTACRENAIRPVDRENFANTSPVATAVTMRPVTDSAITTVFAAALAGYIDPYPTVPIVCTLKQNASKNEFGRALAIPPVRQKATANAALSAR